MVYTRRPSAYPSHPSHGALWQPRGRSVGTGYHMFVYEPRRGRRTRANVRVHVHAFLLRGRLCRLRSYAQSPAQGCVSCPGLLRNSRPLERGAIGGKQGARKVETARTDHSAALRGSLVCG